MAAVENGTQDESSPSVEATDRPGEHGDGSKANDTQPVESGPPSRSVGRRWRWIVGAAALIVLIVVGAPWLYEVFTTVSTDDAYVNGHVTLVAPRVPGQVKRVLVDDNNPVHKGDLLVELDEEPYQAQVDVAEAEVEAAQADLDAAIAGIRAQVGLARSLRFNLEHSIEEVNDTEATLKLRVATLQSRRAELNRAEADYNRAQRLVTTGAVTPQEMDALTAARLVAQAQVQEALQAVYQVRVSLGLPAEPEKGGDLTQVPADLNQTFSAVRQAQAQLIQAAAPLGVIQQSYEATPHEMVEEFYKRDPKGDINKIYEALVKEAPAVKQSQAKLLEAKRNLAVAKLNLSYCRVVSEIDGVVTRRNVNPGNNVTAGQSLMAVRSVTEIWVDANFKETQLRYLRIGQPADLDVDMYGSHAHFKGRVSGFTMGTGSTLALLPPQNATGNFVKVVQRLPVRIDLVDYDPTKQPLFVGLSVEPNVLIREAPTGPNAGQFLQTAATQVGSAASSGSKP